MSLSLVRKLEQGERQDIRIETARKLAVSLDVPTMALIGDAPAPPPVTSGPAWEPVRLALADPVSGADLEPVTEDGLSEALTAAVRLYHDNQYDTLALVLPGLLRDSGDASPLLRSRVLQLTGSLMVQTRQRDLARIALDRSLADAEESGSVLDAASSSAPADRAASRAAGAAPRHPGRRHRRTRVAVRRRRATGTAGSPRAGRS
jgi:hypothetical protein